MKKIILIILLISLFVFAVPAAAEKKEPVGERIDLWAEVPEPPYTYPADTAFHIRHGWILWPPYDHPIGLWDFQLEVDGEYREEDYVDRFAVPYHGEFPDLHKRWYFNFTNGLPEGYVTFIGHYFTTCTHAVTWFEHPGPCPKQNELVEVLTPDLTVYFYGE